MNRIQNLQDLTPVLNQLLDIEICENFSSEKMEIVIVDYDDIVDEYKQIGFEESEIREQLDIIIKYYSDLDIDVIIREKVETLELSFETYSSFINRAQDPYEPIIDELDEPSIDSEENHEIRIFYDFAYISQTLERLFKKNNPQFTNYYIG